MIDITLAKKEFENYTNKFDINKKEVQLKIHHTYGVVNEAKILCGSLELDKEETELALLIALLHDIGRFEQIRKYDTFIDAKSMDHAEYAIKILFQQGLIRKYIKENTYDKVIEKAILNHNKINIDKTNMSIRELIHTKIIRDADKLDIFKRYCREPIKSIAIQGVKKDKLLTEEIYQSFFNKKALRISSVITRADALVFVIAFIFDINFKSGIAKIKEHEYVDRIIDRLKYKDTETFNKIEQIRKTIKEYIDTRLEEKDIY